MGTNYTITMSWIDRRKRAPDVPLKLWRVDCAGFWDEALKKESRLRLQTSRESVARQKKENPEFSEAPKSARRPSYVEDSRRKFTSIDSLSAETICDVELRRQDVASSRS